MRDLAVGSFWLLAVAKRFLELLALVCVCALCNGERGAKDRGRKPGRGGGGRTLSFFLLLLANC